MRGLIIAAVVGAVACGAGPWPSAAGPIDIKSILANPDGFVGQRLTVEGRVHVETYRSAEPCMQGDPRCGWPVSSSLHLVTPGEQRDQGNSIDLYERAADGSFKPAACRILSATDLDCSPFTPGVVTTVPGMFVKQKQATQTVGTSGGQPPQVVSFRDVYFLVVSR